MTVWSASGMPMTLGRMDHHFAGFQLEILAFTGQVIGALAIDLDGGEFRRHLFDQAEIVGQHGFDGVAGRACVGCRGDFAFGVPGWRSRHPSGW